MSSSPEPRSDTGARDDAPASPLADFIDGANLWVDGGFVTAIN